MDVVALISGGKDSFYSLLHCIHNSHRIVALANLHPPPPPPPHAETDELDSFMYQTIGHNLLPLYPSILEVPLYRTSITGTSVNQDLAYRKSSDGDGDTTTTTTTTTPPHDETEDLHRLLSSIKRLHPTIRGVSCGAILSTYQRTRVESVCLRLGLTPLCYLWKRPQTLILRELGDAGLETRIVKVAAVGMDEGWLWEDVGAPRTRARLEGLRRRWGVHVAGEGGEYETVVVGGRGWRGGIGVREKKVVVERGGVAWVKVVEAGVVLKDGGDGGKGQRGWVEGVRGLRELNWLFEGVLRDVEAGGSASTYTTTTTTTTTTKTTNPISKDENNEHPPPTFPQTSTHTAGPILTINNLHIHSCITPLPPPPQPLTIQSELTTLLTTLHTHLLPKTHTLTTLHLLLRTISDFPLINPLYATFFPHPNPPTRITVSVSPRNLPQNANILIHATAQDTQVIANALHVQSTSYWAPANIGPYSQAVEGADGAVEVSGMIALVPASMVLTEKGGVYEGVLALQHAWRVAREMKVGWWAGAVAYVSGESEFVVAERVWRGKTLQPLPLIVLKVAALPRDAAVEWAMTGIRYEDEQEQEEGGAVKDVVLSETSHLRVWRRGAILSFMLHGDGEGGVGADAISRAIEQARSGSGKVSTGVGEIISVTVYCRGRDFWELQKKGGGVEWEGAVRVVAVDGVWWGGRDVSGGGGGGGGGVAVVVRFLRRGG
ncbi:hypothetical protein DFH27DRAFT_519593 [Peziza echinospora]|nr:hypothetical protein DFH27DRAFT_519593 [Peziza echinospora]